MNTHIRNNVSQYQPLALRRIAATVLGISLCLGSSAIWGQNILPQATIQQPTFGVSVSAQGVLMTGKIADPRESLEIAVARNRAGDRNDNRDIDRTSPSRKVSLRRALANCAGESIDEDLLALAGLTSIDFVFIDPAAEDVVIVGPAGKWIPDGIGRRVNATNGRPVLRLEDLALAMTATTGANGEWFGCSIDPTPQAMENMSELHRQIPRSIPAAGREQFAAELDDAMHNALGNADVRIFGLPAQSQMALVLVEADYRMKRMALGLEKLPIAMKSYADLLRNPPKNLGMQRWWLVPDFESIQATEDRLNWRLIGGNAKLNAESYQYANGQLQKTDAPVSRPCRLFADAFTARYERIADASPVFAELRNAMNLLIIAAVLEEHQSLSEFEATLQSLADRSSRVPDGAPRIAPRLAPCVANIFWRGARLLAPAGGGVTIKPRDYVNQSQIKVVDAGVFDAARPEKIEKAAWWWD